MKALYVLATESAEPVPHAPLREAFESEGAQFEPAEDGRGFSLESDGVRVGVRFEVVGSGPRVAEAPLSGNDEARALLRSAGGYYRVFAQPGKPQPTAPVFEALWCVRVLLEHGAGALVDLSAYKVHAPQDVEEITALDFDIRDHVSLHAVEVTQGDTPLWVHSHGMEKFGLRDVEVFHLGEEDLAAAESFLHELCSDLVFEEGPPPRAQVTTSEGQRFTLLPSEEARATLLGVPLESLEGHEGLYLTVVSPLGRHNTAELLRPYRERFEGEPEARTAALRQSAQALLPAFKARFLRRGLMDPLTFLVRAPFEVHPEGEAEEEHLWVAVLSWDEDVLEGRLTDGSALTTEWRKGAQVQVAEDSVNALALTRGGQALDPEEVEALLQAERPS